MGSGNWQYLQKKLIRKCKIIIINRYINMKNPLEMLKEIKSVLGIELSEDVQDTVQEIKLAQMTLENGTIIEAEEFAPEFEVFIVTEEDRIALPVGEYSLEDGMILVVEAEGIIKEIKEMDAPMEEEAPEVEVEVEAEAEVSQPKKVIESVSKETFFSEIEKLQNEIAELKTQLSTQKEVEEQVKEELSSQPAAQPLKHSPEAGSETKKMVLGKNRPMSTRDTVFARIANIKK
jgi:hypothetical protein